MKFILLFALLLIFEVALASVRSSYGEECSRTRKCDRKAWLSCFEGLCDCSKPEEMHYDSEKQKCVTKSGERCKFGVEESGEKGLVEISDCVPNSECSEDGICVCDTAYHEIFNGTCELSKLFGDSCSDEDKCSLFQRLHCINGICNCKEEISAYSFTEGQCVGSLNKNCIDGKCLEGAECKNEKCLCDIDHYEDSSTKTCLLRKNLGEHCGSDSECIRKGLFMLQCSNGTCNCEEGSKLSKVRKYEHSVRSDYYQYYYSRYDYIRSSMSQFEVETCAPSIVGRKCPDGYCARNLKCVVSQFGLDDVVSIVERQRSEHTNTPPGFSREHASPSIFSGAIYNETICECADGYFANKDRSKCARRRGQNCEDNDDCLNNLVCTVGNCQCPSSKLQMIDNNNEYCHSKIGGICTSNSDCIRNSFCKVFPNATLGYCQCKEGYVDNSDGECDGGYGTRCEYRNGNINCDKAAELVCKDKKCSCPDNFMYKYSTKARKCLGLVGAYCNPADKHPTPCVDNAECILFNSRLLSRCNCKKGYRQNENFTCDEIADDEEL